MVQVIPADTSLRDAVREGRAVEAHRPWPRVAVGHAIWERATVLLEAGQCTLLGLWATRESVHMALSGIGLDSPVILSLACEGGRFPSVGKRHAPAIRLERALRDLAGMEPEGLADARPWLDHGTWPLRHPLGVRLPVSA